MTGRGAVAPAADPVPPSALRTDAGVRVWSMRLGSGAPSTSAWALLDDRERERAGRLRSRADADRYVVRHAFYRRVLGEFLGTQPAWIDIRIAPSGRPELPGTTGVDFNTSHTGDRAVIAITRGRRLGVDIERVRALADVLELAATHLTERERSIVQAADPRSRSSVFLAIWTAKEAAVKATGLGLSIPLDSFDTGVSGNESREHVACQVAGMDLTLAPFRVAGDHVGTVAVEGRRVDIHHVAIDEETA